MTERRDNSIWWVIGILAALMVALLVCLACVLGGLVASRLAYSSARSDIVVRPAPPVERAVPARPDTGALVEGVVPGSPADAVGLQPGDIILSIDGRRVSPRVDPTTILADYGPGDQVMIEWWMARNGEVITSRVQLAENPDRPGAAYLGIEYTLIR